MSEKKAKAARHAAVPAVHSRQPQESFWLSWKGISIAVAVVAVIAGSFVLPGVFSSDSSANPHAGMAMGVGVGEGLTAGTAVPAFSEKDVETGAPITSESLTQGKTLLFFSEGVMCQACFQQIKGLEEVSSKLSKRGVRLVSVTPDSKDELQKAIAQYNIRTPMISDGDRNMSAAFNTLGKGMHGDTPGHAFVLMSNGKVLWYRDYWLPPTRAMYVEPQKVLADMPA
jgi:peroxiredoxin